MTRDHSLQGVGEQAGTESTAITRAVGVQDTLALDLRRERVCAGDRYLLCSDGLTRAVPEHEIEALINAEDIEAAVRGLISATLTAGAPDNVTVLVAEAYNYGHSQADRVP
jgi:protein phosphatase